MLLNFQVFNLHSFTVADHYDLLLLVILVNCLILSLLTWNRVTIVTFNFLLDYNRIWKRKGKKVKIPFRLPDNWKRIKINGISIKMLKEISCSVLFDNLKIECWFAILQLFRCFVLAALKDFRVKVKLRFRLELVRGSNLYLQLFNHRSSC